MNNQNVKKDAIKLIDRLYKDLYKSDTVIHHGIGNVYDKFNNIENYIDILDRLHDSRHIDYLKHRYYDKYVIKRENIPEKVYEKKEKLYFNSGYGYVKLTDKEKLELQDEIINNQKASLDNWIDYFISDDSKLYPFWVKYWAFQGMLKLGKYNKENGTFNTRTKETTESFIDLNREALALSMDYVIKMLNKEKINDEDLDKLVKSGSFQSIYSYIIFNMNNNMNIEKKNIGKWVKFNRGSSYEPLINSLSGYNTGWCTTGKATAEQQLKYGDIYIYYTLNENGEYKVPRIAIRMEDNKIVEIRGISESQNIESEMESVIEDKLKEFADRKEYYIKISNMEFLTSIYNKHKKKIDLSKEELRFIYEIDRKIIGFGYNDDPRIEEIIYERRNLKNDVAYVLNCNSSQVITCRGDLNDTAIYYRGNLDYSNIKKTNDIVLPKYLVGSLNLNLIESIQDIILPLSISENLLLNSVKFISNYKFPINVGGNLELNGLIKSNNIVLPKNIGGSLLLNSLLNAESIIFPKNILGDLWLNNLESAEGLKLPETIVGSLYLNMLTTAKGLELPNAIGGYLNLGNLKDIEGLIFPQTVGGNLNLESLEKVSRIKFPNIIGGYLDLSCLNFASEIILPQSIGGDLDLRSLKYVDSLVLPKNIEGNVYLNNLDDINCLALPDNINYNIYMKGFTITPSNLYKYKLNSRKI